MVLWRRREEPEISQKGRPGPPRRLWCDVPEREWAWADRLFDVIAQSEPDFAKRIGRAEWTRGSRQDKAIKAGGAGCRAAVEWSSPGSGWWFPCTMTPAQGERFCYQHGGRSRREVEGGHMPRNDNCERDDTVRVTVNLGSLTIERLPDAVKKIERRAKAVNAPADAVVKFETNLVRLVEADGPDTDAVIEWPLED